MLLDINFTKKDVGQRRIEQDMLGPPATQWAWRGHGGVMPQLDFLVCYIVSLDIGRFKKLIRSDISAFVQGHYPVYPGGSC